MDKDRKATNFADISPQRLEVFHQGFLIYESPFKYASAADWAY